MRFTHKDVPRGFRVPFGPWVIPPIGAVLCLLLMITSPKETGIRLAVWMGIGQIIYFTYGYWHSKLRYPQENDASIPLDDVAKVTDDYEVANEHMLDVNTDKSDMS